MNKIVSHILVGGASALVGVVAGYFICKKKTQNMIEEEVSKRVNEELDRIREGRKAERDEVVMESVNSPVMMAHVLHNEVVEMIKNEFPDETINEYRVNLVANCLLECKDEGLDEDQTDARLHELFASFQSPTEDDLEEEDEEDKEIDSEYEEPQLVMESYQNQPPRVIPLNDYRALPPYFEFLTYRYFEEDDVLIDDQELIVDDVEKMVGDALVHFDEEEDGDCVYVVNGQYGNAIEIVRMHCAYTSWNGWGG